MFPVSILAGFGSLYLTHPSFHPMHTSLNQAMHVQLPSMLASSLAHPQSFWEARTRRTTRLYSIHILGRMAYHIILKTYSWIRHIHHTSKTICILALLINTTLRQILRAASCDWWAQNIFSFSLCFTVFCSPSGFDGSTLVAIAATPAGWRRWYVFFWSVHFFNYEF